MERTLVILKPDAVKRGLVGKIIARFERKGLWISQIKMDWPSREVFVEHYAHHKGKPFFDQLVSFMTSGPSIFIELRGVKAVTTVRRLAGDTYEAAPGSIRGDFSEEYDGRNVVHASDSEEAAISEIKRFFWK